MSVLRDAVSQLPTLVFADILESEHSYRLLVDLPGASAETTTVEIVGSTLHIEARRTKSVPPSFQYVTEDRSLFLDAELPLPPDVGTEGASATMGGGVLELTLPKSDERVDTEIPVTNREK